MSIVKKPSNRRPSRYEAVRDANAAIHANQGGTEGGA